METSDLSLAFKEYADVLFPRKLEYFKPKSNVQDKYYEVRINIKIVMY